MPRPDTCECSAGIHPLESLAQERVLLLREEMGSCHTNISFSDALLTIPTPQLELLTVGGQEYTLSDMESHL